MQNGQLNVDFALRNSNSPKLVDGFIWGVAKFDAEGGSTHYAGSPRAIQVQNDGSISSPRASFRFRIRNYKAQTMEFHTPVVSAGQFSEVEGEADAAAKAGKKAGKKAAKGTDSSSRVELFNLKSDPFEKTNLAATNPAKTSELRVRLDVYTKASVPTKQAPQPADYKAPAVWGEP